MNGWIVLLAFIGGFLVAQIVKVLISVIKSVIRHEKIVWREVGRDLVRSGGMPSGHTASMVAATMVLGMGCGFDSAVFALGVAVTLIIMYDATHVRYAVGEQGKVLNRLLRASGEKELDVVEGHTPAQVVVGLLIGVGVGVLVWMIMGAGA